MAFADYGFVVAEFFVCHLTSRFKVSATDEPLLPQKAVAKSVLHRHFNCCCCCCCCRHRDFAFCCFQQCCARLSYTLVSLPNHFIHWFVCPVTSATPQAEIIKMTTSPNYLVNAANFGNLPNILQSKCPLRCLPSF